MAHPRPSQPPASSAPDTPAAPGAPAAAPTAGSPLSAPPPRPAPEQPAEPGGALTRRDLFETGGKASLAGGAAWLLAPGAPAAADDTADADSSGGSVTVTQGTNISAAASPDGEWIAFDLYTAIWLVPAAGGTARRLTGDIVDATRPRFSPDSSQLVFQAYRDGNYHVYLLDLPDGRPRRITEGPHDHREPAFSPDGTRIALASDREDGYDIWVYDVASGELTRITGDASDAGEPAWTPDGERIVYTADRAGVRATDLDGNSEELVPAADHTTVFSPAPGPGGRLAHVRFHADTCRLVVDGEAVSGDEDVFVGTLTWTGEDRLLYTADGAIRHRTLGSGATDVDFRATVPYLRRQSRPARRDIDDHDEHPVRGIAGPVLSPDGTRVAFRALGALWVMPIGKKPRAIVDDGYFNSDPDWHPDGTSLVYSGDRSGAPALWRYDLDSGETTRLTHLDGAQVTPRWSPDGERIAYQDQDGATWVYDVAANTTRQVLPALFQPGRPTWSRDGRVLALAAVRPRSRRFREGTSQILTVDLETGTTRYIEPAPYRSLSTRGDDGPVWSPDGRHMAFVMDSVLWTVEVDADGGFRTEPRQLTTEPTDAPSWSGDSQTLLYLSSGRLRTVARTGGRSAGVAMPLRRRRARPSGRTLVRAGAVWDGTSDRLRHDVDIVIDRNRITEVRPRTRGAGGARVVDAADLTVLPGLMDAHNHWHLRGRHWGARQGPLWLAYGITATRSPGDPVYQMLETREALESGKITGPRYLATGEAVDGTRIYYNFMRPTHDEEALERELERAFELDYDLVKTYVRLPVRLQRTAVHRAHRAGLPLTSHYLYPAAHLGMDGMEHMGATNRLGYSHTASQLGRAYGDVTAMFAASGIAITPTLFNASALYAEDRSLVEDERTRRLFPAWEYRALETKADDAAAGGPDARRARAALPDNVATLRTVHKKGGLIIGGTDAPLDNMAVSLHLNLRAMVAHGFTPRAALTVTTSTTARWLGLGRDLGAVEPGRLADLAVVEGNPLEDITAAAAVRMTIVNGVVHRVEELMEPFAEDATRPQTRSAPPATRRGDPLPSAGTGGDAPWWHGESERTAPHRC
ncbi:amidohydrolase family protein [Streptomonospora nanhaiensis]|uniref:Tol biopolymer transport system component/imidazolonepropionase-like amidohydrolase n=1 Tax=Streptomonospora nanhaiensis TaxID=1323731 RepID=A0A853BJB6_9ACTN|nr:amidohydrolase family protein [Streptomonospora nanhaiensis]MBV2364614.1 amidohydrolase family protein [Streptomonospora nanhaiensis]MBX9390788.1 amidohydrolase family protein [Streptomonospora nanhaiensis]NYI94697.1 Tol biopolymer transport system component/imidazolonepropionase-like amidohydrolase [Streptomonospora nanhaiensis]